MNIVYNFGFWEFHDFIDGFTLKIKDIERAWELFYEAGNIKTENTWLDIKKVKDYPDNKTTIFNGIE